jgi:hypothetical protein
MWAAEHLYEEFDVLVTLVCAHQDVVDIFIVSENGEVVNNEKMILMRGYLMGLFRPKKMLEVDMAYGMSDDIAEYVVEVRRLEDELKEWRSWAKRHLAMRADGNKQTDEFLRKELVRIRGWGDD